MKLHPLRLHTFSRSIFSLLVGFFWNGVYHHHRDLHYLISTFKTRSFHCRFQLQKQPEVACSHVWRVDMSENVKNISINRSPWNITENDWYFMFCQESLDQVQWICWSTVMMQLPVLSLSRSFVFCAELHHGVGGELVDSTLLSLFDLPVRISYS